MPNFAHIVGWGKYVPETTLTNKDLESIVDTTDEWIRSRTGIEERRIASREESTSTLATNAARQALTVASVDPLKLDLIIVATTTPDYFFPSTACLVQDALGATHAAAYDLSAACSGFIYALSMARDTIVAGSNRYVLVIGAEVFSRIIDWKDRNTCVLFGDGAGAVLLAASEVPGGVLATSLGADGSGGDLLIIPGGGSRNPASQETVAENLHTLRMNGREVFRFATRVMTRASREVVDAAHVAMDDVKLFVPHQANSRIIESAAKSLKVGADRVYSNLHRYGNTSAASVPIALCEAIEEKRINPGDRLVLVGFGAGLTWGAALIQWEVSMPLAPLPRWKRIWYGLRFRWARVESFFRRAWRRIEGLPRTPMGQTRFWSLKSRDGAGKAGEGISKTGKGVAEIAESTATDHADTAGLSLPDEKTE
jgi:3-oxoacyl-[acyl-carrier-protein] synthase III